MGILTSGKSINFDIGLLIIRLGIGIMFIAHGWPKLINGPEMWEAVGKNMEIIGINFAPAFWGFMAGFTEVFGGLCLILGVFWVPACILLIFTMLVAMISHISRGDSFSLLSHPIEAAVLFLGLIFTGAGKYKIGK